MHFELHVDGPQEVWAWSRSISLDFGDTWATAVLEWREYSGYSLFVDEVSGDREAEVVAYLGALSEDDLYDLDGRSLKEIRAMVDETLTTHTDGITNSVPSS